MIATIRPLSAGSALRLWLTPPAGAKWWRVLRRSTGAITGPADPGAAVVVDQCTDETVLDFAGLVDGTAYTYQAFYWDGAAFTASATATGTPAASWGDGAVDVQVLLRERVELHMATEVARGNLLPPSGAIPVVTAPFSSIEEITFPTVSVTFATGEPSERGVGEEFPGEVQDPDTGEFTTAEGWLQRVTLQVAAVSLNSDERLALRRALLRAVQVNLPVFDEAGLVQIAFSQKDHEQFSENAAPLFYTSGTFTCLAPAFVTDRAGDIADVTISPTYTEPVIHGEA